MRGRRSSSSERSAGEAVAQKQTRRNGDTKQQQQQLLRRGSDTKNCTGSRRYQRSRSREAAEECFSRVDCHVDAKGRGGVQRYVSPLGPSSTEHGSSSRRNNRESPSNITSSSSRNTSGSSSGSSSSSSRSRQSSSYNSGSSGHAQRGERIHPNSSSSSSHLNNGRISGRRSSTRNESPSRGTDRSRSSGRVKSEHTREGGGGMLRLLQTAACAAAVAERDAVALREKTLRAAAAAVEREEQAAVSAQRSSAAAGTRAATTEDRLTEALRWRPKQEEKIFITDESGKGAYRATAVKHENAGPTSLRHHQQVQQHSTAAGRGGHTEHGSTYAVKRLEEEGQEDAAAAAAGAAAARVLSITSSSCRDARIVSSGTPQQASRQRNSRSHTWGQSSSSNSYTWGQSSSSRAASEYGKEKHLERGEGGEQPTKPPLQPNFEVSGLLQEEEHHENMRGGVPLKHSAPPDAAMPSKRWRLYMFKREKEASAEDVAAQEPVKTLHLHRRSSFLFGKDSRVADVLLLHPTVSKQHAVLQFRSKLGDIHPYIIDLESTNGTFLNGKKIETGRYYQLYEQDTLRFGRSTRDFVLLHTGSVNVDLSYAAFLESRDTSSL